MRHGIRKRQIILNVETLTKALMKEVMNYKGLWTGGIFVFVKQKE